MSSSSSSSSRHHNAPQLHLSVPPPDKGLFQHQPSPDAKVKMEWEPGCQPDEVYDRVLPPWRAYLRRYLVKRLRKEQLWMADWQKRVRSERRDKYFYWTAFFGTHTFFTAFLSMFFWFGSPIKARALLYCVGLGIYVSSFSKDLVCTPRPYSPPVIRLAMSTHAHEYGFPSSHSTNAVSIALWGAQWIWEAREALGTPQVIVGLGFMTFYASSIILGRVYTGMHSIADIVGGLLMGFGCWFVGLIVNNYVEDWANSVHWTLPLVTIPATLAFVHYHPNPVDPCPCFEDAIAILSVMLAAVIGQWEENRNLGGPSITLKQPIIALGPVLGTAIVVERVVLGIASIVIWRLIAKPSLLRILPPTFRLLSKFFVFDLPTRSGYTAATAYKGVPTTPIRPIPSLVEMTSAADSTDDDSPMRESYANGGGSSSSSLSPISATADENYFRTRKQTARQSSANNKTVNGNANGRSPHTPGGFLFGPVNTSNSKRKKQEDEIKFDAEVLTKVGVYFGIGIMATTIAPRLFYWPERWILDHFATYI